MRVLLIVFVCLLIYACSSNRAKIPQGVEIIPVDVRHVSENVSSFFEKIEVLPLETCDSSLVGTGRKVMYDKEMDIYAIYDKNQVVYAFDGQGHFIASSKKVQGQGPEEYYMAVDVKFNSYRQGIDLLSPYGTVYTYSPSFDLIEKKTIKPEFFFDALMALGENEYIFSIPDTWVNQEVAFVNFETAKTFSATYEGTISTDNTMDKERFYKCGDSSYFVPHGINYYFYKIDKEQKKLIPIIYLDFGKDEIQATGLPGFATGKRVKNAGNAFNSEVMDLLKGMRERGQYIREKNLVVPVVKFLNNDYIYILLSEGKKLSGTFIYDRKRNVSFLCKDEEPFFMWPCFGITDNVLFAICDAYYVKKYINPELMSACDIRKIEQLDEEDNPVILKYYLRR